MHAKLLSFLRPAGLVAGAVLAVGSGRATGTETDAFPLLDNYLLLSGLGGTFDGHAAAFQAREWTSKTGAGGIEDFRYSKDVSKDVTLKVDGHALGFTGDYLAHLNLAKADVASVDAGIERFRTFYDGVGGFFPLNSRWAALSTTNLSVDRRKLWLETTIALPNKPIFTLRVTDEQRFGAKDSTIWGDSDFTGLPTGQTISQVRKFYPGYRALDERHQTVEASVKHTIGKTTVEVRVLGDKVINNDTFYVTRFPGEIKTPTGTSPNNQVALYSQDGIDANTITAEAKASTVLSNTLTLHAAVDYHRLNSDLTGNRPLFTSTPTTAGAVVVTTYNFLGLLGGSHAKIYTGNLGLDWKPSKDLFVQVALRAEDSYISSAAAFSTVALASGSTTATALPVLNNEFSRVKETVTTPTVDLRYTGIRNIVVYGSASMRTVNGDERYATPFTTAVPSSSNLTYNDVTENHDNYTLGVNWKPSAAFNARAEVFNKDHDNKFVGYDVTTGTRYQLGYKFTGVKLTATLKPLPTLSFTSRFVVQTGKMQVTAATAAAYDSMDAKNYTFGESVDWNPTRQFYVQGNFNIVFDNINTIYPRAGVAANGLNANAILQDANNNYWNASALAGFVVDKNTDAQLQYTAYRTNNYLPVLAATTMPYGAGAQEYTVTLGLKHKFNNNLFGSARVGYYSSKNDTSGGNTNYTARLAYLSLEYRL